MIGKKVWFKTADNKNDKGMILDKYRSRTSLDSTSIDYYAIEDEQCVIHHVRCSNVTSITW